MSEARDKMPVACRACGHNKTFDRDVDIPGHQDHEGGVHYTSAWQTVCEGCEASGPLCESIEAAHVGWNRIWRLPAPAAPPRGAAEGDGAAGRLARMLDGLPDEAAIEVSAFGGSSDFVAGEIRGLLLAAAEARPRVGEATKALVADLNDQRNDVEGGEWFLAQVQFDDLDAASAECEVPR